ncbi:MAG: RNA polymerase factor sigma-32 [Holosporaceae bacterium]|jgi:RNA polymerase sigma-32 factor|nr:RNA polymerase factor sigma-32 [Holosporaceae bacterium]
MSFGLRDESSLSHYISEIKKFPILDQDEEYELALRWKEKSDQRALDKIIKSHLRLVYKIANGYSGYGLPKEDLIAEGHVGIMHALQHFDPSIGYRFSTYAAWWIKAKIKEFVYNAWSIVKLGSSKNNRKLFFGLRKQKKALGIDKLSDEDAQTIADAMQVSKEDVLISENRFANKDYSSNVEIGENSKASFQDFLVDTKASPEEIILHKQEYEYRKKILHDALATLSKREYDIVCSYRLQNPTKSLRKIGEEHGISAERVRQIEMAAFLKIQKYARSVEWAKQHSQIFQKTACYFINVTI